MRIDSRADLKDRSKNYPLGISDKIVLTSKSRLDTKAPQRKPVKECYCISEISEKKEPWNEKPQLEKYSSQGHGGELVEIYCSAGADTSRSSLVATLLGYETLRRAGRLTYLPNSEFLRRVQKKVCHHRRKNAVEVCSSFSSSLSSGDSVETSSEKRTKVVDAERKSRRREDKIDSEKTQSIERKEEKKGPRREKAKPSKSLRSRSLENSTKTRGKEKKVQRVQESKTKPKVSTNKIERSVDGGVAERPKSRKIIRTISAHSRCCNPKKEIESCPKQKSGTRKKESGKATNEFGGKCDCKILQYPETSDGNRWQLSRDRLHTKPGDSEEKVRELSKFRRANYFETHGSVETLVGSSRSSMLAVDPCEFNDRFFAADPRSSGKNIKRIHYYPSYVVREERLTNDRSSRKKTRSRNSDLIGHVVDLGILKIPCDFSNNFFLDCHNKLRNDDDDDE